jgi:hypothetical protein
MTRNRFTLLYCYRDGNLLVLKGTYYTPDGRGPTTIPLVIGYADAVVRQIADIREEFPAVKVVVNSDCGLSV